MPEITPKPNIADPTRRRTIPSSVPGVDPNPNPNQIPNQIPNLPCQPGESNWQRTSSMIKKLHT